MLALQFKALQWKIQVLTCMQFVLILDIDYFCLTFFFYSTFVSSFTQTKVIQVEKKLQGIKSRMDSLREEQESLSVDSLRLKEQVKAISKAHKEQEVLIRKDGSISVHCNMHINT